MKKLIVFIALLSFSTAAFSDQWVLVNEFEGRKHYIDPSSIKENDGLKLANHKSEYSSPQIGEDYPNKRKYGYIKTESLISFNCKTRTLIPINTSYYSDEGKKVNEITFTTPQKVIEGDKQWELDDNPDTFRAAVIGNVPVCGGTI